MRDLRVNKRFSCRFLTMIWKKIIDISENKKWIKSKIISAYFVRHNPSFPCNQKQNQYLNKNPSLPQRLYLVIRDRWLPRSCQCLIYTIYIPNFRHNTPPARFLHLWRGNFPPSDSFTPVIYRTAICHRHWVRPLICLKNPLITTVVFGYGENMGNGGKCDY